MAGRSSDVLRVVRLPVHLETHLPLTCIEPVSCLIPRNRRSVEVRSLLRGVRVLAWLVLVLLVRRREERVVLLRMRERMCVGGGVEVGRLRVLLGLVGVVRVGLRWLGREAGVEVVLLSERESRTSV